MNASESAAIHSGTIARLAEGVKLRKDDVRGQNVLLAPERAIALDEIALRIVQALDGETSVEAMAAGFAEEFGAPADQIAGDIIAFLDELHQRRMLETVS